MQILVGVANVQQPKQRMPIVVLSIPSFSVHVRPVPHFAACYIAGVWCEHSLCNLLRYCNGTIFQAHLFSSLKFSS